MNEPSGSYSDIASIAGIDKFMKNVEYMLI